MVIVSIRFVTERFSEVNSNCCVDVSGKNDSLSFPYNEWPGIPDGPLCIVQLMKIKSQYARDKMAFKCAKIVPVSSDIMKTWARETVKVQTVEVPACVFAGQQIAVVTS